MTSCFFKLAQFLKFTRNTVTSLSKLFTENSDLSMEPERARQNKSCHFCLEMISFSKLLFFNCFYIVAFFANRHTKSTERHKLFRVITPKPVEIDMSSNIKKCLNLGAFSDTSVSFPYERS